MILVRKIIFIICGALILMSSKCAQTKVILQNSPEFKIFNAYTQRQVPGERNQKPYIEFGFEVKGITKDITLDSVFCEVGKSINIKLDGKNRLKLLVGDQLVDKLKYAKAIFYYTQKGSKYSYVLNDIKSKETIFLP